MTYSTSHASPGYGDRYQRTYNRGYYAALWRDVERPLLGRILAKFGGPDKTLLDFACGTGRITDLAADCVGEVVGVDVSTAMTSKISPKGNVVIKNMDLTASPLDRQFDIITAFRFFLNAERELRTSVLAALHGHLKSDGVLIANIHMNSWSPMGVFYAVRRKVTGRRGHNVATYKQFTSELRAAGFEPAEVYWYSYLPRPGPLAGGLMEKLVRPFEAFGRAILPHTMAQSFIVVARRV